ncbi:FAD-binding protein [uncultured Senegalimassilia sp.]|uniref:FAD-binding protein n=1 Tax=uncultured Senegalimassilia sp. TaxID=1714350 RepID=UPI0026E07600|nr:FAD-binding protein [uncultured Senegalimassilia sp.]
MVIVGCGVAGLYCALNLPRQLSVVMLAKTTVDECDSMLAQGGICVQHDADDYAPFFEDTLRAGHFENRCESVDLMIRASRSVIDSLVDYGVQFECDEAGQLRYTREGAHSRARICFHDDTTGAEITTKLLAAVRKLGNVRILENTRMSDILTSENGAGNQRCSGIAAFDAAGRALRINAQATVWACGGIGGTYERSTNFPSLTGDALHIARVHGIALEHTNYVQIHPTSLYTTEPGRAFLISESCRGEGAVLLDVHGRRFVDELQPRDVVSAAIYRQMEREGSDHVRLSFASVPKDEITGHFQHIYEHCLVEGYDITREPIPVVPAQHYFMGGVHVDRASATSMPGLYAAGETSCNGVHGKNRLASNSLLESLVFAQRAAWDIARRRGLAAPHPQTYAEHPAGADAQAYGRLCALASEKLQAASARESEETQSHLATREADAQNNDTAHGDKAHDAHSAASRRNDAAHGAHVATSSCYDSANGAYDAASSRPDSTQSTPRAANPAHTTARQKEAVVA